MTEVKICTAKEVGEESSIAVEHAGQSIIVVKKQGQFYAYLNSCPHTGGPLDWISGRFLDVSKQYIQCATHDALFEIKDGLCVAGPCRGQRLTPLNIKQNTGDLYITIQL